MDGQVKVYRNGNLFTTVEVTDLPYYQEGGYIGVWLLNASSARVDNFGGGSSAQPGAC